MSIKSSMLFRPDFELIKVPAASWKTCPEEPIHIINRWLKSGICGALKTLPKIVETMCHMRLSFFTKIESFQFLFWVGCRVEGPTDGILYLSFSLFEQRA